MSICACYNIHHCLLNGCATDARGAVTEKRFVGVVSHVGLHELRKSTMKSFLAIFRKALRKRMFLTNNAQLQQKQLVVFRKALRRRMRWGLVSLTILGLVGGGSVLLLSPLCTYSASSCSFYGGRPGNTVSHSGTTHNYNPQVPVQTNYVSDVNLVFRGQRLSMPKSHVTAPTGARRVDPVPTPTRGQITPVPTQITPVPTPTQTTGGSSVAAMIEQVFGPYAQEALHVANCESGLNPNAYNPASIGGSHAEGVFQILYPSTWMGTPEAGSSPYNAMANILAAHSIFVRDGYSWREWSCA